MSFLFDYHPLAVVITPSLVIQNGQCETPECKAMHFRICLSFLVWTGGIQFSV